VLLGATVWRYTQAQLKKLFLLLNLDIEDIIIIIIIII